MTCRCGLRAQPYARADLTIKTIITCAIHTAKWKWDGVAFIPFKPVFTFLGVGGVWVSDGSKPIKPKEAT